MPRDSPRFSGEIPENVPDAALLMRGQAPAALAALRSAAKANGAEARTKLEQARFPEIL